MPDETNSEQTDLNVRKIFAANIRRLRMDAQITQKRLGELTGLQKNFINEIENLKKWVSPETIAKLANAFHIEPLELFLEPSRRIVYTEQEYADITNNFKRINETLDEFRTLLSLNNVPNETEEKN